MLLNSSIQCRCTSLLRLKLVRLLLLFSIVIMSTLIVFSKRENCWLDLYRSRLFCFVLTHQNNLEVQGRAVYETWGRRCGRFVFVTRLNSSQTVNMEFDVRSTYPIENIPTLPDEIYSNLPDKVRSSLLFFYETYPNYDWYLKADDDTYVIVENLLRFLISTKQRHPRPVLYGYRFRESNYVSGGAGYVLTRDGLQLFGKYIQNNSIYAQCSSSMEDMMVGQCLQKAMELSSTDEKRDLTLVGETVDQHGRERFHPLAFRVHFNGPLNKQKREWIHEKPFHHNMFGYEAFSETSISFHYTKPTDMYQTHTLLYDIRQFDKQIRFPNEKSSASMLISVFHRAAQYAQFRSVTSCNDRRLLEIKENLSHFAKTFAAEGDDIRVTSVI